MERERNENQLVKRRLMQAAALVSILIPVVLAQLASNNDADPLVTNRLLVISLTGDTSSDSYRRLNRSISVYQIDSVVIDTQASSRRNDGLQSSELDLLRGALSSYRKEQDLVILILRGDQIILNGDKRDILTRFQHKFKSTSRIVMAADSACWPQSDCLASKYPIGSRVFVSSNALIGLSSSLWQLFMTNSSDNQTKPVSIQTHCTQSYLNEEKRNSLRLVLDERSELFQSIRDHDDENAIELEFGPDSAKLKSLSSSSEPVIVFGSKGSTQMKLNTLGNYLAKSWTKQDGCNICNETSIDFSSLPQEPTILLGLFIVEPTPFLNEFFEHLLELDYPKDRIHLFVYNSISYHRNQVDKFLHEFGSKYAGLQIFPSLSAPKDHEDREWQARDAGLDFCRQLNCDYYFSIDSIARLELASTLQVLIEVNRTIVAPVLNRPRKLWSNFWGSMTRDGFYARSFDYVDLVKRDRLGLWNVPQVMNAYLIDGKFIHKNLNQFSESNLRNNFDGSKSSIRALPYYEDEPEPDRLMRPQLAFSHKLRSMGVFQYALNTHRFGHLIDPTNYDLNKTRPDFYQLEENPLDWERVYLHENYTDLFEENELDQLEKLKEVEFVKPNPLIEEPCPDVFWFPLVSPKFSTDLIAIMEAFGRWSNGNNDDPRIDGGYESVPTRDIHLKQVGLHEMWLTFLRDYVMPVQLKQFIGYEHDPPRAELAFVVRYHPSEQPSLRPHHDSSTYTLNIALNSPDIDYEGGGCRFVRYNCSVTQTRPGWAMMHPGKLTHYHEGLPVTRGTRYIFVTFVDP